MVCGMCYAEASYTREGLCSDCNESTGVRERFQRMHAEIARLREELAALQAKRRVVMCVWCGTTVYNYPTGEMGNEQHAAAIIGCREHDSVCPDNPLRQRAELAERREREALAMLLHVSELLSAHLHLIGMREEQSPKLIAMLTRAREQEVKSL